MKPSRQYHMLAQKIQAEPRRHAAKLVLEFLGSAANDDGESCHGYKSIMKNTGIRREETVLAALRFWSVAEGKTVVGWETGKGGGREGTNKYKLNLAAMKTLVKEQGLFDPETGKALDHKIKKLGEKRPLVSGSRYNIKIGRPKAEPAEKATPSDPSYNHTSDSVVNTSFFSSIARKNVSTFSGNEKSLPDVSSVPTVSPIRPTAEVEDRSKPSPSWSGDGLWYRGYELEPDDAASEDLRPMQRLQLKWKRHDKIDQLFKLQEQIDTEVKKQEVCEDPDELETIAAELERLGELMRRFRL